LAIELAAALVRLLSPQALLMRLGKRLPLLTRGARDVPARQQTMRDAIGWSHDLLTREEQTLLHRLAVFSAGCTLDAAEAVADPESTVDVFDGIASLVDKSLLRQEETVGEPRFRMLETVREFALERLEESGAGSPPGAWRWRRWRSPSSSAAACSPAGWPASTTSSRTYALPLIGCSSEERGRLPCGS
jgi:predicted ATPase